MEHHFVMTLYPYRRNRYSLSSTVLWLVMNRKPHQDNKLNKYFWKQVECYDTMKLQEN